MSRIAKVFFAVAMVSVPICSCPIVFAADASAVGTSAGNHATVTSRHALDRLLPEVKFNGATLSDVIDFLADSTESNISVDWKALDAAHVAKDAPVTLRMSSKVPLRKILQMVLQQAAGTGVLTFYVDEGVIEITSQEASDKVLISRTYPIQDLLFTPTNYNSAPDLSLQNASQGQTGGGGGGGGTSNSLFQNTGGNSTQDQKANSPEAKAEEIIKLITDTVKPELWQINGGTATISFFRGSLVVNAPRSIHELLESRN